MGNLSDEELHSKRPILFISYQFIITNCVSSSVTAIEHKIPAHPASGVPVTPSNEKIIIQTYTKRMFICKTNKRKSQTKPESTHELSNEVGATVHSSTE